ncbi:ABC transporter permease [Streptacidiphilus carbonis]|uniref:ABC transporter permease n=1 Tax=Streptacidiphilus carbonis TaxID=105422 RepID=UPI00069411DF|nr:ABC-2 family transporter protein [Streptacidiphilus carbonis]
MTGVARTTAGARTRRAWRAAGATGRAGLRERLADKADFALAIVNGVTYQVTVLLFATVVFTRFPPLAGWTVGQVLLVSSVRLLAHAVFVLGFTNVREIPYLIRQGRFDSFLLRPAPVLLQVCTSRFPLNAVGDLTVAVTSLGVCLSMLRLDWTPARAGFLVLAVASGAVLELALALCTAGVVLLRPGSEALFSWLDTVIGSFGNYPLNVFPAVLRAAFTFVLPVAFVAFYPVAAVLGKADTVPYGPALTLVAPLVALVWLGVGRWAWRAGLRAYRRHGW